MGYLPRVHDIGMAFGGNRLVNQEVGGSETPGNCSKAFGQDMEDACLRLIEADPVVVGLENISFNNSS